MRAGFSVIELLIGSAMLAALLAASAYALKPVNAANKRFRLTNKAHQLEDEVRRGTFFANNYSTGVFVLEINGVIVAKQGETRIIKEDFSDSQVLLNNDPDFDSKKREYPLLTRVELVTSNNLVYQIQGTDSQLQLANLGSRIESANWPPTATYITTHANIDHSILKVPPEIATSIIQRCPNGIMRGIQKNQNGVYEPVCWNYQAAVTSPTWSIPTGFKLDAYTNQIEVLYSALNKPKCPSMSITNLEGNTWNLPNFYAFASLDLNELFPPQAAGSPLTNTQCELAINFLANSPTGILPKSLVDDATVNNTPGACPDINLYILNSDGTCSLNFNSNTIPTRVPAMVNP